MKKVLFSFVLFTNLCYSQEYAANADSVSGSYNNQRRNNNYANNSNVNQGTGNSQNYNNGPNNSRSIYYSNNQNNDYRPQNGNYTEYENERSNIENQGGQINNGRGSDNGRNSNNRNIENADNEFLKPSASPRKGMDVNLAIYRMDRNGLYKDQLNASNLKKAVIIFFGSWCPYCAKYLNNLSKNINELVAAGIKIIFVHVPAIEILQNWQIPKEADYTEANNKLSSFGIRTDNSIELVLLGDRASLNNNAVDSLPTMLAVKNGKEQFRGGSDNSIDIADFSQAGKIKNFLQIWDNQQMPESNKEESCEEKCKRECQLHSNKSVRDKSSKASNRKARKPRIDIQKTNAYTDKLNRKGSKYYYYKDSNDDDTKYKQERRPKKKRPICPPQPKKKPKCIEPYSVKYCPRSCG